MNPAAQQGQAAGVLFDRLFDDAAVFPPGNAPMQEAVRVHLERRHSPIGRYVGPFICSGPRWCELVDELPDARLIEPPFDLALTVPGGPADLGPSLASVLAEPRVALVAVELPLVSASSAELRDLHELLPHGVAGYVELEMPLVDDDAMARLAEAGLRLKLRAGGPTTADFPREEELARSIKSAATHGVPFKLTAGLHHAVRYTDPATGFEHHGFLNVMWATAASRNGADEERMRDLLAERDAVRVGTAVACLSSERVAAMRQDFTSFGTCSIGEPMADLAELHLLEVHAG